jgi:hypothetical protein
VQSRAGNDAVWDLRLVRANAILAGENGQTRIFRITLMFGEPVGS